MSKILGGVPLGGFVSPTDSLDTYATHDEFYGKGGYKSVANQTEREDITTERRKIGMFVYQSDTNKYWTLKTGITNSDWVEVVFGGSESALTKHFRSALLFDTVSPISIGTLPANAIVSKIIIDVETAFNGSAPTLDIGISGTIAKYVNNSLIDLKTIGTYIIDCYYLEVSSIEVIATYNSDSSTNGSANILLKYEIV